MRFAYTVPEVAEMSGLSESQIRRLVHKGALRKIAAEGNSVRIGVYSITEMWPDAAAVLLPPVYADTDPTPAHGIVRPLGAAS